MKLEDILSAISETYAPLTPECQEALLSSAKILSFEKNTTLVRAGQFSDKTFYIIQGCARAYYLKDGKDISDWFAFENEFISSIVSFFKNEPSPHAIELLEDSLLVEFSRDQIEQLATKYHDFERLIRAVVTTTMLKQHERIVSIQFETAEKKYQNLLETHPTITQRVPLTHLASYLGITLETLSRIRGNKKRI